MTNETRDFPDDSMPQKLHDLRRQIHEGIKDLSPARMAESYNEVSHCWPF